MSASFTKSSLLSRAIRKTATGGSGIRKIDFSDLVDRESDGAGSIVKAIFRGGKALLGWAASALFKAFSFVDAAGWLQDKVYQFLEFDWNASDAELKEIIKQQELAIYSQLGTIVGSGVGWLTSIALGYGISLVVPVIGGAKLAKLVAGAASNEAAAAIFGQLQSGVRVAGGNLATIAATLLFIQKRKEMRNLPGFKNWGRAGGPRFVISEKYENFVQKIPYPKLKAFVTGFSGGFEDGFFDGLYVVASVLDDQVNLARETANQINGPEREIAFYPDYRSDEKIIMKGPERLLIQQVQEELSSHRRLADKDVGIIIGEDARNVIRPAPQRRILRIIYKNSSKPPWNARGVDFKSSTLQVPDLKNTSWEELKRVLKPFTWGRYYHCIPLDNGRKILSSGASPAEARANADRLLSLTTANALSNRIGGEREDLNPLRQKRAVQLYPVAAILEVKRTAEASAASYTDPSGKSYKVDRTRFNLWPATKPGDLPEQL